MANGIIAPTSFINPLMPPGWPLAQSGGDGMLANSGVAESLATNPASATAPAGSAAAIYQAELANAVKASGNVRLA